MSKNQAPTTVFPRIKVLATEVVADKTYIVIPVITSFGDPPETWLVKTYMDSGFVCYAPPCDGKSRVLVNPKNPDPHDCCGHNFYGPID